MTRILSMVAASAFAFGAAATAAQADMTTMMNGYAACNSSYMQCLQGGSNMTLATTPQAGMSQMQANMQNSMSCGEALRACYASVK
jgi:hypothetical protein